MQAVGSGQMINEPTTPRKSLSITRLAGCSIQLPSRSLGRGRWDCIFHSGFMLRLDDADATHTLLPVMFVVLTDDS